MRVMPSPAMPLSLAACTVGRPILVLSTVKVVAELGALVLPAMSVWRTVMLLLPLRMLVAWKLQAPLLLALTVLITAPLLLISTLAPFSAPVPLMIGWAPGDVKAVIVGAATVLSTVTLTAVLAALRLPAASTCLAVML